jgi:L-serine dehydratase
MGPMTAANRFLDEVLNGDWVRPHDVNVAQIKVSLHGSLAYTGVGHGTDRAVFLGLMGHEPNTIDPDAIDGLLDDLSKTKRVQPEGHPVYQFDPKTDLEFDKKTRLDGHANGMIISGFDANERLLIKRIYYSIGGGFVVTDTELEALKANKEPEVQKDVPYPFANADQMLEMAASSGLSIAQMKRANEEKVSGAEALNNELEQIWNAMNSCIERGLKRKGIMPGGLNVERRAAKIYHQLQDEWKQNKVNPMLANDWLSVYAMAVNEENASGGRVVTAPTNGAAGVIPAVIAYMKDFLEDIDDADPTSPLQLLAV